MALRWPIGVTEYFRMAVVAGASSTGATEVVIQP